MDEAMKKLVEDIRTSFEDIGMYLQDINVMSDRELDDGDDGVMPDVRQMMLDGEAQFVIVGVFALNEFAFTDKVLNPDKHKADVEFQTAMPTEADVTIESLKEKLRKKNG